MAMVMERLFIVQLCIIFVLCGKFERLQKRMNAIQTLTFQDIQSVKEGVLENALKIDSLTDLMNKTLLAVSQINQNEKSCKTKQKTSRGQTSADSDDLKKLQRAFQEHKLHSLSLQVNTYTQLEKIIHNNRDGCIKNVSEYVTDLKSQMSEKLDDMTAELQKTGLKVPNDQEGPAKTPSTCADSRSILTQTEAILKEVNRSRQEISNSISALRITNDKVEPSSSVIASCIKVVNDGGNGVTDMTDHKCIDINEKADGKFAFHCDNRNIRLGDAKVTEVGVEGRVEVRYNNHWGTVCRDGFDDDDATVACKMAGFARGVVENRVHEGSGTIWLDDTRCKGDETNLFDCPSYRNIGGHDCTHRDDTGVRCFWLA